MHNVSSASDASDEALGTEMGRNRCFESCHLDYSVMLALVDLIYENTRPRTEKMSEMN